MALEERWHFCGDVNLEHGGAFIDLSTWDDGYCSAVRVTDLDSGCGFTGACLIEHIVINGTKERERILLSGTSLEDYVQSVHLS